MMFGQMLQQISRDMMLLLLCVTPVFAGCAIRFGIPVMETVLCTAFKKQEILAPWYFIFDWLLALLPGMMYAFTGGLVILGEIDDKIDGYMAVTPAGNTGYLFSRLGYPVLVAAVVNLVLLRFLSLSEMSRGYWVILGISSSFLGILTALLVVAVSGNKVEGMAIGKLSGLIGMGMFVPVFLHTPLQYVAGILPSFWIGKLILERNPWYLWGYALTFWGWLYVLLQTYQRKRML